MRCGVGDGASAWPPWVLDAEALGDMLPATLEEAELMIIGPAPTSSSSKARISPLNTVALMKSPLAPVTHFTTRRSKRLS